MNFFLSFLFSSSTYQPWRRPPWTTHKNDLRCALPKFRSESIDLRCALPRFGSESNDLRCALPTFRSESIDLRCALPRLRSESNDLRCALPKFRSESNDLLPKFPKKIKSTLLSNRTNILIIMKIKMYFKKNNQPWNTEKLFKLLLN